MRFLRISETPNTSSRVIVLPEVELLVSLFWHNSLIEKLLAPLIKAYKQHRLLELTPHSTLLLFVLIRWSWKCFRLCKLHDHILVEVFHPRSSLNEIGLFLNLFIMASLCNGLVGLGRGLKVPSVVMWGTIPWASCPIRSNVVVDWLFGS